MTSTSSSQQLSIIHTQPMTTLSKLAQYPVKQYALFWPKVFFFFPFSPPEDRPAGLQSVPGRRLEGCGVFLRQRRREAATADSWGDQWPLTTVLQGHRVPLLCQICEFNFWLVTLTRTSINHSLSETFMSLHSFKKPQRSSKINLLSRGGDLWISFEQMFSQMNWVFRGSTQCFSSFLHILEVIQCRM